MAVFDNPYAGAALDVLSEREKEVLRLLGHGLTVPEIAQALHRSQKTIESHRLALGRKLGVNNRVKLARLAIQVGLSPLEVEPPPAAGGSRHAEPTDETGISRWEALRRIDQMMSGAIGPAFAHRLLPTLAEALGVRRAVLGELVEGEAGPGLRVWTERTAEGEAPMHDPQPHRGPAGPVLESGEHHIEAGAAERFPACPWLADLHTEGFVGCRLVDARQQPLGILAVAHDRPLEAEADIEPVLRFCASRASIELERGRLHEQLKQARARLSRTSELHHHPSPSSKRPEPTEADHAWQIQYLTWLETTRAQIGVVDQHRRIVFATPALCELLGRPREDVLGQDPAKFLVPEERDWYAGLVQPPRAPTDMAVRMTLLSPTGERTPVRIDRFPLFDAQQRYLGTLSHVHAERRRTAP